MRDSLFQTIMHRLIEFIKLIYVIVLFVLLEGVALWSYATSSPYTEAKILSRTTAVGAAVSGSVTYVENFFALPRNNRILTERVAELTAQVQSLSQQREGEVLDAVEAFDGMEGVESALHFRYHPARVVSMTTNRQRNLLVVDRGTMDGIYKDMGVVTPENELVGYVVSCSDHYSVVQPMLNADFSTGGCLVDNGHVCVVWWSGDSMYEVDVKDLSVYAEPYEGMRVDVRSERLPDGVLIGTISSYELNSAKSAYSATITIAADMSKLDNLLIVENTHYGEIEELMTQSQQM